MTTVSLDVRALPPPEPLERILEALDRLPEGGRLRVWHRREPFPLYDLLRRMGYAWETSGEAGHFEIQIWRLPESAGEVPPLC